MTKSSKKNWLGIAYLALAIAPCVACGRIAPDTPLSRAAAQGSLEQVTALLGQGADPNDLGRSGLPPLVWAARAGHVSIVEALLGAGAQPDLRDRRTNEWTPLVHALHKGQDETARLILEAGADPNARMDGGATPLMFAASYGNTVMVRTLLERGADPRAEASGGVSALWGALGGGALFDFTDGPPLGTCFPETARALLEKDPDLKLKKGFSGTVVKTLGRSKECSELIARLGQ